MAALRKQFFLAPSFDYPPDGLLQLGRIFDSPLGDTPLNPQPYDLITVPDDDIVAGPRKSPFKENVRSASGGRVGVFATFLQQFLSLGASLGFYLNRDGKSILEAHEMGTKTFEPTKEYLTAAMNTPQVIEFLEEHITRSECT